MNKPFEAPTLKMKHTAGPGLSLWRGLLAALISITSVVAAPENDNARPNFIIFLADDLGYGDLACYGHPVIQTPHLDALAESGVRLTDCHSGGTVCSPSRASLLTGRTPCRSGFYYLAGGADGCHLRDEEVTLATLLQNAGYDTCFVGKWHVGKSDGQPDPGAHGFDHWLATERNAFDGPESPKEFVRNGVAIGEVDDWYCNVIVREAIDWMANRPDPNKPFFLLVSSHEPHTPLHPPEKYSKLYENTRVDGLESAIPYGQVHRPLERDIQSNKKYYYGTVTQLDDSFGRLMKAVDEQGQSQNSVVVFTSDNGPETPVTVEESDNEWEDPIRDRCFGTPGPWRGMKRYVLEGGHRVPGLVRWPGTVAPGTVSSALVNGTDWLPTLCAAAGVALPQGRTIDGVDAKPALKGKPVERPIPACWLFPVSYDSRKLPGMSMRDGDQVLVGWFVSQTSNKDHSAWVKSAQLDRFALYDLSLDRSQSYDLATKRPEEFKRLKQKMRNLWREIQDDGPIWKTP